MLKWIAVIILSFALGQGGMVLDDYENGLNEKWETKSFEGNTRYTVTNLDGKRCIHAKSNSSASGLFYKIEYDAKKYPYLSWSWKIKGTVQKGDARKKAGDDYAARVYVVFQSTFFWNTKALNYIWANRLPKGEKLPNPFTENAAMIAVESGAEKKGTWVNETRNIYEDYKEFFGEPPGRVGAIAIMTDTDNTKEQAEAWYGKIRILPEKLE